MKLTCRQSYSTWRLCIFRQLFTIDDHKSTQLKSPQSCSSAQRPRRREYHHSHQLRSKSESSKSKLVTRKSGSDTIPRARRVVVKQSAWKPTSPQGQADLKSLVAGLRAIADEKREQVDETSKLRRVDSDTQAVRHHFATVKHIDLANTDLEVPRTTTAFVYERPKRESVRKKTKSAEKTSTPSQSKSTCAHLSSQESEAAPNTDHSSAEFESSHDALSYFPTLDQAILAHQSVNEKHSDTITPIEGSRERLALDQRIPISSLELHMDKARNKLTKLRASDQDRNRLIANPWARMLAAPMRNCGGTRVRMPTPLLVEYGLLENEKDGETYHLPHELGDLVTFNRNLVHKSRSSNSSSHTTSAGRVHRILPDHLLHTSLTKAITGYNNQTKVRTAKKGAIMGRLISSRWIEEYEKAKAYDSASKEYWDVIHAQGGSESPYEQRQEVFDLNKIKWQPDISERLLSIMRQRVLIVLSKLSRKNTQSKQVVTIPRLQEGEELSVTGEYVTGIERAGQSSTQSVPDNAVVAEFWNDMGDIEASDAITGVGNHQGSRNDNRPPIAIRPDELQEAEPFSIHPDEAGKPEPPVVRYTRPWLDNQDLSKPSLDNQPDWLSGAIIIDTSILSSFSQYQKQPWFRQAEKSNQSATSYPLTTNPHTLGYIPPTLTINTSTHPHHIPVFPLCAMLGYHPSDMTTALEKILQKWPETYHIRSSLILFKTTWRHQHVLVNELWQLWRYIGGRNCLSVPASPAEDSENAESPTQVSRLSEPQREQLYELCELEESVSVSVENGPDAVVETS